MTDSEKIWNDMVNGMVYDATHPYLIKKLQETREKIWEYNNLRPSQKERRASIVRDLLGACGKSFKINQPFRCDYGCNIYIGEDFFANFNLTILDEAEVHIGDNAFIGPNVSIYTACHPLDPETRDKGVEWAEPVKIGNSVWIGGSVTILPGITIGDNVVIGAGSVVTKDIPSNVMVAGNPAKIIREI